MRYVKFLVNFGTMPGVMSDANSDASFIVTSGAKSVAKSEHVKSVVKCGAELEVKSDARSDIDFGSNCCASSLDPIASSR